MQALARQHVVAGVTEDIDLGHYFKVPGAGKTRTIWIKEVGQSRVLKKMDLDDIDGRLVGRETTAAWGFSDGTGEGGVAG